MKKSILKRAREGAAIVISSHLLHLLDATQQMIVGNVTSATTIPAASGSTR